MTWLYIPESIQSNLPTSPCSAEAVENSSPANGCTDGVPSAMLNTINQQQKTLSDESERDFWTMLQSGMMCELLTAVRGVELTSLREAFPANRSPWLVNSLALPTLEICGLTPSAAFARLDRATSSWRTCRGLKVDKKSASKFNGLSVRSLGKHGVVKSNLSSSLPTSGEYSQTWPKAGLMLNGVCYPQPKLELRINEIGYGLLPTVTANKQTSNTADPADMVCKDGSPWVPGKKPYDRRTGKPVTTTLHDFLRFPAPNTMDALPPKSAAALEREATVSRPGRTRPANLRDAVGNSENLPAPRANERGDYQYDQGDKTKPRPRLTLSGAVKLTNLPTPKTNNDRKIAKERNRPEGSGFDEKMSSIESNSIGCYLSPDWVEWLMGWPIRWTAETCTVENFVAWLQGMVTGTWWLTEPEGVPRTISQGENRVERIRMLGNGQVPLQAAVAVHLLAGEPKHD